MKKLFKPKTFYMRVLRIALILAISLIITDFSTAQFRGYEWGIFFDQTDFSKPVIAENANSFNITRREILANKYSATVTYTFSKKSTSGKAKTLSDLLNSEFRLTSGMYKFEFSDMNNSRYYEINDILKDKYGDPDDSDTNLDASMGYRISSMENIWRTEETIIRHLYKDYKHFLIYLSKEYSNIEDEAELNDF